MNAAERLEKFCNGIEAYIEGKNFTPPPINEETKIAEELNLDRLSSLTKDECFDYAFILYQYADQVVFEKHKHEGIVIWCENNLNKIISEEIGIMSQQYTKHEIKVGQILKENEIANLMNEWKNAAQIRVVFLSSREYNIRRKADILIEKGKRK